MAGTSGRGRGALGTLAVCAVAAVLVWWLAGDAPTESGQASPLHGATPVAPQSSLPAVIGAQSAPSPSSSVSLPPATPAPAEALSATPGLPAPWARLVGRVVRPDGSPAADVTVVHPLLPGVNLAGQLRDNPPRTAADGSFRIEMPQAVTVPTATSLLLDAPPAARVLVHVPPLHPGDNDLGDLVLADGAGLAGRLVDPDGKPLARAYATVRAPPDGPELFEGSPDDVAWQNLAAAFTFDDGRFVLTGLPAVPMELFARADGFQELNLRGLAPRLGELTDLGDLVLSEGRVLQGVLLDADDAPVAARQVMASAERSFPRGSTEARADTGQTSGYVVTDEQGRFRIGGLQPGVYELDAWAEGHAFTRLHGVADDRRDVVLRLQRAGRVLLTLRDGRTLAPLGGATVTVTPASRAGYGSDNAYVVTSGPEAGLAGGTYLIDGFGEDAAKLTVSLAKYGGAAATIEGLGPGEQRDLQLDLAPSVGLAGLIEDQFEQPVAGVTVQAAAHTGPAAGSPTHMLRPAADGRFHFDDLATGTWQVWAYADGHGRANTHDLQLPPEGLADVIVRLPVLGRAEGLVATADGTAVPAATVVAALIEAVPLRGKPPRAGRVVIASDDRPTTSGKAGTDADGRFVLDGLWPGTWLLAAALGPAADAQARLTTLAAERATALHGTGTTPGTPPAPLGADVRLVTILDGEATNVDLAVPVPAQLAGRALSDGRPLAGARVVLGALNGESAAVLASADTGADGSFRFANVAPGSCVVMVFGASEVVPRGRRVTLHDGEQAFVEVSFQGPTLRGVVVNAADRRPVGDVDVTVFAGTLYPGDGLTLPDLSPKASQVLGSAGLRRPTFRADSKGRFEVPHLPPGRWLCFAEGDRWLAADRTSVEVPDDWKPEPIEVQVTAAALVQGTIRYAFGGGWPPSVEVQLWSPERDGIVKLDHPVDGHYLIGGVTPGVYELRVRDLKPGSSGAAVVSQSITLGVGESATVDLIYKDS